MGSIPAGDTKQANLLKIPLSPFLLALALVFATAPRALSYGDAGHQIVGAAADERLREKQAAAEVAKLLGPGVTLERASTIADELRGEERRRGAFQLPENPALHGELLRFLAANPSTGAAEDSGYEPPSHGWFHYTNIPIQEKNYAGSAKGRFRWDIVQTISYCARVLAGSESAENPRRITRGVALVLLAHFVGDIHQPLHVGAAYLDKNGELRNPNHDADAMPDRGGNNILFGASSLHAFWDIDTVESALGLARRRRDKAFAEFTPRAFGQELASREPARWQPATGSPPETWAGQWADEMLALAREAHRRLRHLPLEQMNTSRSGAPVMRWHAITRPHSGRDDYGVWSANVVADALAKAGWRLAALIEASLTSPAPKDAPTDVDGTAAATPAAADDTAAAPASAAATPFSGLAASNPSGEIFAPDDLQALRVKIGSTVTVEGTLAGTGESRTGAVRYLNFAKNYRSAVALVFFRETIDLPRERLEEFVGKSVRVTGQLSEHEGHLQIVLTTLEDVRVLPGK